MKDIDWNNHPLKYFEIPCFGTTDVVLQKKRRLSRFNNRKYERNVRSAFHIYNSLIELSIQNLTYFVNKNIAQNI